MFLSEQTAARSIGSLAGEGTPRILLLGAVGRVAMALAGAALEPRLSGADSLGRVVFRRTFAPLLAAAACAVAAGLVWLTAYHLSAFAAIDQRTLDGFQGLLGPETARRATQISELVDPRPFALFAAAIVLVALVRRRPRTAVAVAAILAGSNLTTQLLKPALAKPQLVSWIETATWPSGHATAAMALALCLQLSVPLRLRPAAAALGGLFAVGVVYSILILGNHVPSDMLGGFLVAGAWTGLGVAALNAAGARWPPATDRDPALRTTATLVPVGLAAAALTAAVGVFALAHWNEALDYAARHTTFVAGAAFIALGALGVSAAASLGLTRRRSPRGRHRSASDRR